MSDECPTDDAPRPEFERYVHQNFHRLSNAVQAIVVTQELQTKILDDLQKVLTRCLDGIDGNGKPGLKAEVREMGKRIDGHDAAAVGRAREAKERSDFWRSFGKWGAGVAAAVVTAAVFAGCNFAWAIIDAQHQLQRQVQQLPGGKPPPTTTNP